MAGNKPTNDSPIQLRITPKAQWPLQRFITSDEVRFPIAGDNPLLLSSSSNNASSRAENRATRKQSTGSDGGYGGGYSPNSQLISANSPSSYSSSLSYMTPPSSLTAATAAQNDWIKQIEINTHIGPHRRLFMGPQFVFKTFNSNLTTTMLNPTSSSVIGDAENPIIDLSGDIELNSLDLSAGSKILHFLASQFLMFSHKEKLN